MRGACLITVLALCGAWSYAQVTVTIGNGIAGNGALSVPVDELGAWYVDFNTGAGGDSYTPAGYPAGTPTFATGTYLFSGTAYREALVEEPVWFANWNDASLDRAVTGALTAFDYAYNDGVDDTAKSGFTVFSGNGVVNLQISLTTAVRRTSNPNVSYVVQIYRITNNASSALNFKLYRTWDLDLMWDSDFENDEVCGGTFCGQGYASQGEVGVPAITFSLSSLNPISCYVASKRTYQPPGAGCPTMGYGTDFQEWDAYGVPSCWCNYVAYFGPGPGCSGANFGDGHIGVEVPVSLAAGATTEVIFIHTYGKNQPALCNLADVNTDGVVDDADLLAVLFYFGYTAPNADVDTNFDGVIDDADLLNVLFNFGNSC
jgi:hypothetical protein